MGVYRPKLQPKERLVWRWPRAFTWRQWAVRVAIALGVGGFSYVAYGRSIHPDTVAWAPFWALLWSFYALAIGANGHVWYIAITDRRLLVRRLAPWHAPLEMPLGEVEGVAMDIAAYRILVRGGGREIQISPELVDLPRLKQALGFAEKAA